MVRELYGHKIEVDEGEISCVECEETAEYPELVHKSSGFYDIIYRMYVFAQFKRAQCSAGMEVEAVPFDEGTVMLLPDNRDAKYEGDGEWTIRFLNGSSAKVTSGELFLSYGTELEGHLPDGVYNHLKLKALQNYGTSNVKEFNTTIPKHNEDINTTIPKHNEDIKSGRKSLREKLKGVLP